MAKSAILNQERLTDAVRLRPVDSIDDILDDIRGCISRRAFELFETNGHDGIHELDDWLAAERELFWRPTAQIAERDGKLRLLIVMPGARAEDVDVRVTDHQLLVQSEQVRLGFDEEDETSPQLDELPRGRALRVFDFERPLDTETARASLRDGVLRIEVQLRPAAATETPRVEAAA